MIGSISISLPPINPLNVNNASEGPKGVDSFNQLTEEEQKQVDELKKIDKEVRDHENAHKRVGGQYASNPTYDYTVGPDDNRYATSGEVQIDTAPIEGDPEATIAKMDVVIAAALAPAKPSAQDRKVAAAAVAARNQARADLIEKEKEEQQEGQEKAEPFDVNDFGNTPQVSVNKAYAGSLVLGQEQEQSSGQLFSEVS